MPDEERGPRNPTAAHDQVVLDDAQVVRLQSAITRLRRRDREIFLSSCRDRLPHPEIASRHRCSVAKVEKVIAEVLVALHEAVWPHPGR